MKLKQKVQQRGVLALSVSVIFAGLVGTGCQSAPRLLSGGGLSTDSRPAIPLWFDQDSVWGDDFTPAPDVDDTWMVVPRAVWVDQLGIVSSQVDLAYAAFRDDRPRQCEVFIRRAAAQISVEAARSKGEERLALEMVGRELYAMANEIANGQTVSEEELRITFAHTTYGLALHHAEKAWVFAEQSKSHSVGLALQAAADNLQQCWHWMNIEVRESSARNLAEFKAVSREILAGQKPSSEQLEQTLDTLDSELVYAGLELSPGAEQ